MLSRLVEMLKDTDGFNSIQFILSCNFDFATTTTY